jgi:hypothetical protein
MSHLIAGYINSFWNVISTLWTALNRIKKEPDDGYKYSPTSNPTVIIEQLFISSILSVIYLNLLTFLFRMNEFVTSRNFKVYDIC